jgi:SAM-dependent methyltransferase
LRPREGVDASAGGHDPEEDPYGTLKRLLVFGSWLQAERQRRGSPRLSILDFGCGTGLNLSEPLAAAGDLIHGVDVHEPSIAAARARPLPEGLTFGTESASELAASGAHYDVIICSEVLEHLVQPARCLADLRALLVDDGLLLVSIPNGLGSFELLSRVERALVQLGVERLLDWLAWLGRSALWRLQGRGVPARPGQRVPPTGREGFLNEASPHVQFFRLRGAMELFAKCGFRVEEVRGRTLLCGPYADFWWGWVPFRRKLLGANATLADALPLALAADWMFRLRRLS